MPLPSNIALFVKLVAPVPPLPTGSVPVASDAKSTELAAFTILLFESRPRLLPLAIVPDATSSR